MQIWFVKSKYIFSKRELTLFSYFRVSEYHELIYKTEWNKAEFIYVIWFLKKREGFFEKLKDFTIIIYMISKRIIGRLNLTLCIFMILKMPWFQKY